MFRNPTPRHETVPAFLVSASTSLIERVPFGDVLTLPVRLLPPEMGIVVVIGAFCRYWEGVLSAEGENGAHA